MKRVMVFGVFDGIHDGHRDFFKQARALGDHLTVLVATDKNVAKIKRELPKFSQEERLKVVEAEELVDEAFVAPEDYDYILVLKKLMPDVIALGYDQKPGITELKTVLKQNDILATIVRLKAFKPKKYKSSFLKGRP